MLLAITVAACGGIDPGRAPLNAKTDDFCAAYSRVAKATASTSSDKLEDYLNELARFGTPRGIPTAARNGFEYVIDPDHKFSDGGQLNDLAAQTSAAGQDAAALKAYARTTC
ncbi:hypothetical protein ABIE44_001768 [Marmoricola sp. OAE513]|uniref:hypothetical protein n=1 Tax=Marmoricola sp. OAE513 TaxID=2817894 RepID=UPI003393DDE2